MFSTARISRFAVPAIRVDISPWTLGWMGSVVVVMYLVMGAGQAMKSAAIEDVLSMIPAAMSDFGASGKARSHREIPVWLLAREHARLFASAVILTFIGALLAL